MYPSVYYFSFIKKLSNRSSQPPNLILEIGKVYEDIRWSDEILAKGGGINIDIKAMRNKLFAEDKITGANNLIQAYIQLNRNDDFYKYIPNSNRTILTQEITVMLIPSTRHPFREWETEITFKSKEYTITGEVA